MAGVKNWTSLSEPNEEWQQAVKTQMGGNQPDLGLFPDIQALRDWITNAKLAMSAEMGPQIPGVVEHDEQVEMRDGHKITCRIHKPENPPAGGSPLMVMFHGGGWCIGGLENEELQCRLLASKLGMTCVNVDYRLAPEWQFPYGPHDCIDATKWAAANVGKLGADPSKGFIIGGTSAGGNMTAVVAHQCRDDKLSPPLTGCLLMIPIYCDAPFIPESWKSDYKSYDQNKAAPILTREAMDLFMSNYCPEVEKRKDPLISVALWENALKDMPPSFFQVCGQDPLRDDAFIVEREMREKWGIKTKVEVYPGLPHGFHSVLPTLEASKKFVNDTVEGARWLLEQK